MKPDLANEQLRERLAAAEEALRAIREGEVDALVVGPVGHERIFTTAGANEPYRVIVEEMPSGAATLSREGTILYANPCLQAMLGASLVGTPITRALGLALPELLSGGETRLTVRRPDGVAIPILVAARALRAETDAVACLIVTDLSGPTEAQVARKLTRSLMLNVARNDRALGSGRRDLGRALAQELGALDVDGCLSAARSMGLGKLTMVEQQGDRYTFRGDSLLEIAQGASAPTRQLTLGFVEGVVSMVTGRDALGTEIACESQGRDHCTFVASAREP